MSRCRRHGATAFSTGAAGKGVTFGDVGIKGEFFLRFEIQEQNYMLMPVIELRGRNG